MKTLDFDHFLSSDYVNFGSYDNVRKIASCIDGLKNAQRKIVYTLIEKNVKELVKVSQLGSKVAEFSEYLHGNIDGVIITLAQDFLGTNQVPLLDKKGNFGTRLIPENSATRYIFAKGSKNLDTIFNPLDNKILPNQVFEGTKIEPKFYVPTIPMILVNPSNGISSGFSQKILARNVTEVISTLKNVLNGGKIEEFDDLIPYFKGFKGQVIRDAENPFKWLVLGSFKREGKYLIIDELPPSTNLLKYVELLDKLKDEKVIKDWEDFSNGDRICYKIEFKTTQDLLNLKGDKLIKTFQLSESVTENLTVMGSNKVLACDKVSDFIKVYLQVKGESLKARKNYLLKSLERDIEILKSKIDYIKSVTNKEIDLSKIDEDKLVEFFVTKGYYKGNEYNYLLSLTITTLTRSRQQKLQNELEEKQLSYKELEAKTIKDIWLEDLNNLNL